MALNQAYINIGPAPNDGLGDPIRTAFSKTNNNFSQLFSIPQSSPPSTLQGSVGDFAGMYAYDSTYFYYCFANYTGNSTIWAQITQAGNIAVSAINNGNSNVAINGAGGNVIVAVKGTPAVATFGTGGLYLSGVVSAAGNVRGNNINTNNDVSAGGNVFGTYIFGNGSQLTGLPATYSNANVATYLPTYSGNLTASYISATGNITGNYILGNGSLLTGLPATYSNANVAAYLPTYSGNISAGNITVTGSSQAGNYIATGNVSGNNINSSSIISATGNIITAGYFVGNFAGNITGNLVVPGVNTQVLFNTNGNSDAVAGMTYNKGSNTFIVLGTISSQGNTIAGNVVTVGLISAAGNISGNYILGNGSQLTGLPATYSNANVAAYLPTYSGNLTAGNISVTGTSQAGSYSTAGNVIAGNVLNNGVSSVTGNITGGNILTGGLVSATGSLNTNTTVVAQGNIRGGNIISNGLVTATGNITGGNILTAGIVSATGNLAGAYIAAGNDINAGGNVSAVNHTGTAVSVTGNITGGNLVISSGNIVSSNATAYLFDSGVTDIRIGTYNANSVTIGTSNSFTSIQGNATVTANINTNVRGALLVNADYEYMATNQYGVMLQLQGQTNKPTRLYVDSTGTGDYSAIIGRHAEGNAIAPAQVLTNSIVARYGATPYTSNGWPIISTTRIDMYTLENQTPTSQGSQIQFWTTPVGSNVISQAAKIDNTGISVTGNVTANYLKTVATTINGNITTTGLISATGNITGGNLTTGLISATGVFAANIGNAGANLTASSLTVGNILNANGNAVGNIGNSSNYFNTVFAQATTALYADLAEKYIADADYAPGTVLSFGGSAEVTSTTTDADPLVAGVVSTNPAYCMNSGLTGDHVVTVALVGRVPCQVEGPIARGAMMVSAGNGRARAEVNPAMGTVIGKALEAFDGEIGTIEIVVGRL